MCEKASGYLQDSLATTPADSSIDKVRAGARGLAPALTLSMELAGARGLACLRGLGLSTPWMVPLGLQKTAGSAQQHRTGDPAGLAFWLRLGSRGEWLLPLASMLPS